MPTAAAKPAVKKIASSTAAKRRPARKKAVQGPVRPVVEPNEGRSLPELPREAKIDRALEDIAVAVNGFVYPGDSLEAIIRAVKWLRGRPDLCRDLGLAPALPTDPADPTLPAWMGTTGE